MKQSVKEWTEAKKWNPFNSYKLLSQVYRWRLIQRGQPVPQPALVTIDPTNRCDLNCIWCNSSYVIKKRSNHLSRMALLDIADFLRDWQGSPKWEKGVEAVCIAGGGEPLINPHTPDLIDRLVENGIQVGMVTNGTNLWDLESLSKCTWIAVSVDAGTPETFEKIKGRDRFDRVIKNIKYLIKYSKDHKTTLASSQPGYGVSFNYLLHPYNVHEITKAVKIAKDIGVKNFHLRPAGVPWDKLDGGEIKFSKKQLETFKKQINEARNYESKDFGVYGVTHKFSDKLQPSNIFKKCYAVFMTCGFFPSTDGNLDHMNIGLCCDRRGDESLEIAQNISDVNELGKLWGSKKHWEIFDSINLKDCPRCTYQPHNQIYEHVIQNDSMTYTFI